MQKGTTLKAVLGVWVMKHGKYYATGLVVLLLIGGGTGIAVNHNNSDKATETHKSIKSSSSSSHKVKKHSVKKSSSSKSSSSTSSSESVSSQSQVSSSEVADSTTDSGVAVGQPTPQTPVAAFIQKYGVTPAQWLVQNKGMSIEDALYATPDDQETSGELQSEWAYKQGTHDDMVSGNTDDSEQSDDDYWTDKAWEDNADFYGEDGTHYHNDDQGNTYDVDSGYVIGKGSTTGE